MEVLIENIITYSLVAILFIVVIWYYIHLKKKKSKEVEAKILKAKEEGIYEPVSLHPVIDPNSCIQTGACIAACPEKDILGIHRGKATTVNASMCIGHGACFHACPTQAITLCIGTDKRGVDLPHVDQTFETNVKGIYIAGEIGGMGLIRNAVEQGKQAVENLAKTIKKDIITDYDLIIIGAGPAGISASLTAKKMGIKALTLEQDSLGGTVYNFPRSKIVMTNPMEIPLYGKVKSRETSKTELLNLWYEIINKNNIEIREKVKVENIISQNGHFVIETTPADKLTTKKVLLAIGRRGTPRKLNIPGEESEKVAYRLLEPELIIDKNIVVVGGGDSAIESALSLADQNKVWLSYRNEAFSRLKPKNKERIDEAIVNEKIIMFFNSNLTSISDREVTVSIKSNDTTLKIENDLVYIFAGGELPLQFLNKAGIKITRKFGDAIMKHE